MKRSVLVGMFAIVGGAMFLGGCCKCGGNDHAMHEDNCGQVKSGVVTSVNTMCVVNPKDPVDPALVAEWKGQKVGFCCAGCVKNWNAMTPEKKDALVAAATKKK